MGRLRKKSAMQRGIIPEDQGACFRWGVLLLVVLAATRVGAATYTVTTLGDVVANDSVCSLREAIEEANDGTDTDCAGSPSSADDTITFSVAGTITLGAPLPNIVTAATAGALTINGGGNITISGNNAVRVMWVNGGGNLTLQSLRISNGRTTGSTQGGAGIYNDGGTLTLTNSTFSDNSSTGGSLANGGGIYNNGGTVSATDSTFSYNGAGGEDSYFYNHGGAIYNNGGSLIVIRTTFFSNLANSGGGIYNTGGWATVISSSFLANSVLYFGGGIYNHTDATLVVTNSRFSANSAAHGGGIANGFGGTMDVTNTTFSANSASTDGGAILNNGTTHLTNSTLSGNSAGFDGGGIFNLWWLMVTNTTLSGNSAANSGGGVRVATGWVTLRNTLVANSTSGGDCVGTLTGININNLIEDATNACGLTNGVAGNIIGIDPGIGALTGSPAYFPLNPGSPAIDTADNATCAAAPVSNQSQNGVTRPQDGNNDGTFACDIGSFEAPAVAAQADMSAAPGSLPGALGPGQAVSGLSFSCTNNGPDPATSATCSIAASAGTVSNVSCVPPVQVSSLSAGSSIACSFDFTAPGSPGGSDTPETGVTFTVTTGADNDTDPTNNTASNAAPIPMVDALDDAAAFAANTTQTYNVGTNDQFGSGSLPGTASFSLGGGSTCGSASVDPSTGVATFQVPATGSCTVVYQVCVGTACDSAKLTVTAQVADMTAALGSLPGALGPGQTVSGLTFSCTNSGPDPALNATCSIAASAGVVSNVVCMPSVPVASLAAGASIACTYDFAAPGTVGGGDTPETGVTFTVTTGADNDTDPANNTASNASPIPIVDALDDAASFPASTTQTFNVGANDQYGTGGLPGSASFTLLASTTCSGASITSPGGVATFQVPTSGTCVVAYRVCAGSGCETAQLVVTAQQQLEPIPSLDQWGLAALVFFVLGAGVMVLRRMMS